MSYSIRTATIKDSDALSKICLLTANFGTSAEHLHHHGELPGLIYALPYVNLPTTFGFVLRSHNEDGTENEIVGYILGTWDTPAFNAAAEKDWYPELRHKYPLDSPDDSQRTEADKNYISRIHKPDIPPKEILEFSPAHIHIDILPEGQRKGWGKKLIGAAVTFLSEKDPTMQGLWVGVDPRNEEGKKFYRKIGGKFHPTSHGECYVLRFSEWQD